MIFIRRTTIMSITRRVRALPIRSTCQGVP